MNKSVANDCQKIIINVSRRTGMDRHGASLKSPRHDHRRLSSHMDQIFIYLSSLTL